MSIASIVLLLSVGSGASASELASLAIDCDRRFEVDITLTNDTAEDVTLWQSQFPWSLSSPSLRVRAYATSDGKASALTDGYPPATYLGEETLRPGQTMSGTVDLRRIFADLEASAGESQVAVILEVAHLPLPRKREDLRFSRWLLLIPKQSLFFAECPALVRLD